MSEATELPTIFAVFAEVKRKVGPVGKDSENKQQHFKFRGVDAVVNEASTALDEMGVIIAPLLDEVTYGTVEIGEKRTRMAHVKTKVVYRFYGPRGDFFDTKVPAKPWTSATRAPRRR